MPTPPVPNVQGAITSLWMASHTVTPVHLDTTSPVPDGPPVNRVLLGTTKCCLDRTTACSALRELLQKELVLPLVDLEVRVGIEFEGTACAVVSVKTWVVGMSCVSQSSRYLELFNPQFFIP